MNCRCLGSTHSIHFWTTWLPFWSLTHFRTCPSSSFTISTYKKYISFRHISNLFPQHAEGSKNMMTTYVPKYSLKYLGFTRKSLQKTSHTVGRDPCYQTKLNYKYVNLLLTIFLQQLSNLDSHGFLDDNSNRCPLRDRLSCKHQLK